ncbi:MAG TPA: malonyl CoA-acyl carrier protein transacylase, partial [Planctomycetota bacterium]|nr:malonyl CoA-acyl carrier protein transacylase [Planctomycetota bacterium]
HSELMRPAADDPAAALAEVEISRPQVPVISNVTADYVSHPDQIRDLLVRQLTHPVKWCPSMQKLAADGVNRFYEIGPGRVLAGLMRRIDRELPVVSLNSLGALEKLGK